MVFFVYGSFQHLQKDKGYLRFHLGEKEEGRFLYIPLRSKHQLFSQKCIHPTGASYNLSSLPISIEKGPIVIELLSSELFDRSSARVRVIILIMYLLLLHSFALDEETNTKLLLLLPEREREREKRERERKERERRRRDRGNQAIIF